MQTQAFLLPQLSTTVKSVAQRRINVPAKKPPLASPVKVNDIVQRKTNISFNWMKSNTTVQQKTTAKAVQPSRQSIVQPKAKAPVVQLKKAIQLKAIQPKIEVGAANDHYEQEADRIAETVVSMPNQTPQPKHQAPAKIQTSIASQISLFRASQVRGKLISFRNPAIQRQSAGTTNTVPIEVESRLNNSSGRGSPMDTGTRNFFEPRFGADFGGVKIHTDRNAAQLNNNLGSAAFAYGSDVYFNQNQYNPASKGGRQLIAHELTHVVQQGGALRRKALPISSAPRAVQRLGVSDILNFFAEAAYNVPGFRMFTIVIGVNPINMQPADRSAANILRAIIEFLPGGNIITRVLDRFGVLERAGAYVEQQLNTLGISGSNIRDSVMSFIGSLGLRDLFSPGSVWERAKRIFTEPIGRIISFVRGLFNVIKQFIWDAVLRPLAALAANARGYDLVKAILGRDPISGDPFPRTPETLIGGFMKLIGQEEIWENIKRGNAVARAFAWFQGALSELMGFVTRIPTLFVTTLRSLELSDFLIITNAIGRIFGAFGNFVGSFISWAGGKVMDLLEILFSVVAPSAVPYLKRAAGAFRTILSNPVGFIGNLVRAAVLGFRQFGSNFLRHLRTSLIQWLTGALPSVYIPQALNIREIIKFVLSVLGLTWQNIRQKLVRAVGETAVRVMETGFDLVVTLVTQGPAAAWQQIMEGVSNLQQMVMDGIMNFVKSRIVDAAITRLLSMLTPAGAFIQAIIAIYNTVMFFVERLRQIAQVAASFIDSISAIASGSLGAAANRVEQTMAGLLTLVISFLARIAGLGNVSTAVMEVINRVRAPIDRALDRVVDWIVQQGRRLLTAGRNFAGRIAGWFRIRKNFRTVGGASHVMFFRQQGNNSVLTIRSVEMSLEAFLADLAVRYASDAPKRARVNQAQALVSEIRTLTAAPAGTGPSDSAQASVDSTVQAKIEQLGPILQEIGDGVSMEGATAAYRGLHWWVDPTQDAGQDNRELLENQRRFVVGARQLSDAVRTILANTVPATPTESQIDTAANTVRAKMRELRDGTPYDAEGKQYYDRFHFLLGRYVMKLDAFKRRITAAGELAEIRMEITTLQASITTLGANTQQYYEAKRRLQDLRQQERATVSVGVVSAYSALPPQVRSSPFIATSLNAQRTAQYAFGLLYVPSGKVKRTSGNVGRMLIFVASVAQLVRDGTYSIDELRTLNRIVIRRGFSESELTFTGDIPGEYLRATLDAQAGQSPDIIGSNARARAQAEGQRFGGLK